jgi:hypothetical protein
MPHHLVEWAHAEPFDVPISEQDLKDLDGGKPLFLSQGIHQGFDLDDGGEIPYEYPARQQAICCVRNYPPGFRDIQDDPIKPRFRDPLIDIALLYLQIGWLPHIELDVFFGPLDELLAPLIGDDLALCSYGTQQGKGEGAGADPRFENGASGVDVGIEEDEGEVFRIDDGGVPLHVHDVLYESRPEDEERVALRGAHHRSLGFADDLGVEDFALVEVDVPFFPHPVEELLVVLHIQEDDALTFGNGLGHHALRLSPRSEYWEELRVTAGSLIPQFCCEIMPSLR